jgi:hypothetical protein
MSAFPSQYLLCYEFEVDCALQSGQKEIADGFLHMDGANSEVDSKQGLRLVIL